MFMWIPITRVLDLITRNIHFLHFSIILFIVFSAFPDYKDVRNQNADSLWMQELDALNYLILKISSVNLLNGLFLSSEQAKKLRNLAIAIDTLDLKPPSLKQKISSEFNTIKSTFLTLLKQLKNWEIPSDSFALEVNKLRIYESAIIKKTLLGVQKNNYQGEGCLKCHAPPRYFPKGDITKIETNTINSELRKMIDYAHVEGIFKEQGIIILQELMYKVDKIISTGQKFICDSFRCCLIPPKELADPINIGQVLEGNKLTNYFTEVRSLSDNYWGEFKELYIIPFEDYVDATLPGIRSKDKNKILKKIELIIEKARKMDTIDFELQKESLNKKFQDVFKVDFLTGRSEQYDEERLFLRALFLLFPGSVKSYDHIIKKNSNETQANEK